MELDRLTGAGSLGRTAVWACGLPLWLMGVAGCTPRPPGTAPAASRDSSPVLPGSGPTVDGRFNVPGCSKALERVYTGAYAPTKAVADRQFCTLDAPAFGTGFAAFLPMQPGVWLSDGTSPAGGAVAVAVSPRSDGTAAVRQVGEVPVTPGATNRSVRTFLYLSGSPDVLVHLHERKGSGEFATEVWAVPLGSGAPRLLGSTPDFGGRVWPLADGGAAFINAVNGTPASVLRFGAGPATPLASGVTGGDDIGPARVRLHAATGDSILDLRTATVTPAPALPGEARVVYSVGNGDLLFTVRTPSSGRCGTANDDLFRLPTPWTATPERIAEGIFGLGTSDGGIEYVQRPRASKWAEVVTDLHNGKPPWALCGDLEGAPPGWLEGDLFRIPAAGGSPEALGCAKNVSGDFFGPHCDDIAPVEAAMARVSVPAQVSCPTLEQATDLCWAAIVRGDLDAYATCEGSSRPFPDLGSDSILGLIGFYGVRAAALRLATGDVAREQHIEGSEATVRLSSATEAPLAFEFAKDGCGWRLTGAGDPRP